MNFRDVKKILIVEDDLDISFALSSFLEFEGHKVDVAENGLIALDLLGKHGVPDLILLDMKMPVMNGWEFASEFNAKYDSLCPIVVMTAAADAKRRAEDINAVGYIEKPFAFDRLRDVIKKYIKI